MKGKPRKPAREKDLTSRYLAGALDEDRVETEERFSKRSKHAVQNKLEKTAAMRAVEEEFAGDVNALPVGEVVQVYSLFSEVEKVDVQGSTPSPLPSPGVPGEGETAQVSAGVAGEGGKNMYLCVVRKTLAKASETAIVVGDFVRFRESGGKDEQGRPEAVIEAVLPRRTVLTRSESFKGMHQHPIVANAEQMLIVASILSPRVKWGLVDRMLVAAQSGKLQPIVCLNKIDLISGDAPAEAALAHYESLGVRTLKTAVPLRLGLDALVEILRGKSTVLAGHSGVGKSSLIRAIEPTLDIRVGEVSGHSEKGMHTTTSARRYTLGRGGNVIDTPGVKQFGLWGVSRQNLTEFFPDVEAQTAPEWRVESMKRIEMSLPEEEY